MKTLVIPDDLYDEALTFCNHVRGIEAMEPITELPAGLAQDTYKCPCASGVDDLCVEEYGWHLGCGETVSEMHPTTFVRYFDNKASFHEPTLPVRASSLKKED